MFQWFFILSKAFIYLDLFIYILIYFLEDSCLTVLCWFPPHISTWISLEHRSAYVPFVLNLPPTSQPNSTLLGCHRAPDLSSLCHPRHVDDTAKTWEQVSGLWRSCSVAKWCPPLWDLMDCSTPGSPVLYYLPEFAQILVHWVSDAI